MALLSAASRVVANPNTVPVRVAFVNPIAISEVNPLRYRPADPDLASLDSVTVSADATMTYPENRVDGDLQVAARLIVVTTPGQAITIHVDEANPAAGFTLADFTCNYGVRAETACDGTGYSETTDRRATLSVGVTLMGDGTASRGVANGSINITVAYQ